MTSTAPAAVAADLLDSLLHIAPDSALHAVRHAREKVASATQASHALFFAADLDDNLSLSERLWVAYYAAYLTPQPLLSAHYLAQLRALGASEHTRSSIEDGALDALGDARLGAILRFTRTLIESPVHGDQAALTALQQQGLSTEEIVVLGQLIAFLSYQVRLVAGLGALQTLGEAP